MSTLLRQKIAQSGFVKIISVRQVKSADIVYLVKEAGFDGFYIDTEHGIFSLREISDLCMAAQSNG